MATLQATQRSAGQAGRVSTSFLPSSSGRLGLLLVLAAYLLLASGYALLTPAWNNPDEPAHFNYVRHVATTGSLPELRAGDWDAERLEFLKAHRFPPSEPVDAIRYESHQPPLYYLLAAPLYLASAPFGLMAQVMALRGLSILLGTGTLVLAYSAARRLWPEHEGLAATVASLVAFVPMYTAMSAAINNDALANLLGLALVLYAFELARGPAQARRGALLGLLCGAVLLTKLTAYALVPLALGFVSYHHLRDSARKDRSQVLRTLAIACLTLTAVSAWWFVRNGLVYGWDDPLGLSRHAAVVVGQPRWADLGVAPLPYFATTLFQSFWAQFGWMGVLVDQRLYWLFAGLVVLALAGGGLALWRRPLDRRAAWMALAAGAAFVTVALYNLDLVQPQGRYLFPALFPLAGLAALGWQQLAHARWGAGLLVGWSVAAAAEAAIFLSGAALNLWLSYALAALSAIAVWRLANFKLPSPGQAPTLLLASLAALNLACLVVFVGPYFR